jgi:Outer membrane protein beta-barrel domain
MKRILALAFFTSLCGAALAQNCAQTLRLARSTYDQGRLHELPGLLKSCLSRKDDTGFTKEEKVEAYKLLTLAYIYLEEPGKADSSMLKLLRTDPYFEINSDVDPAEFIGLYYTFRTRPVFSIGLKFGANGTFPLLSQIYYVGNTAPANGSYKVGIGFQYGVVFEKQLFTKSKNKVLHKLLMAPEVLFTNRTFTYSNPQIFSIDSAATLSAADQQITVKQTWIDFNPIVQYTFSKSKTFVPYLGIGPGISYFLSAANTSVTTRSGGQGVVSGPDVATNPSYRTIVPSVIVVAGLKFKLGSIFVTGDLRAQYGLASPVNPAARSIPESVNDYVYSPPDYKPLNIMANVGFVFPYFKPIKTKIKRR